MLILEYAKTSLELVILESRFDCEDVINDECLISTEDFDEMAPVARGSRYALGAFTSKSKESRVCPWLVGLL